MKDVYDEHVKDVAVGKAISAFKSITSQGKVATTLRKRPNFNSKTTVRTLFAGSMKHLLDLEKKKHEFDNAPAVMDEYMKIVSQVIKSQFVMVKIQPEDMIRYAKEKKLQFYQLYDEFRLLALKAEQKEMLASAQDDIRTDAPDVAPDKDRSVGLLSSLWKSFFG